MTILVVGEALMDLIVKTDGTLTAVAGGGPFNTARTIARLGAEVSFLGGVSDDVFGRQITAALVGDGVAVPLPARAGFPTTLALAELEDAGAARYEFYTAGTSAAQLHEADIPASIVSDADVIHVGTLGLLLQPLAGTVESVVQRARHDALVFVDPNCRPGVAPDEAAYRARLTRLLSRADVVKVSGDDMAYLDPGSSALDSARALLTHGPRVVLFTDGANSVHILRREAETVVLVPKVDVVDTVGAGDAFGGAFLAFWVGAGLGAKDLEDQDRLIATVERAIIVAAITCSRAGANPPRLDELPL